MFRRDFKVLATASLLTAMTAFTFGTGAATAGECESVRGQITSQLLTGTDCTSPVGLCTIGRFRGDIRGEFVFTAENLTTEANPDFGDTGIAFYTGTLLLQTEDGSLTIKDAGAFNVTPNSNGDFGSVQTIMTATEELVGTTGRIRTEGVFIGGCVDCRYRGEICTP